MESIVDTIIGSVDWVYAASVLLITYIMLTRVILKPKRYTKIITALVTGLVLGVAFYYLKDAGKEYVTVLTLSFLVQTVFYNWLIKGLLEKFTKGYDNGKGII